MLIYLLVCFSGAAIEKLCEAALEDSLTDRSAVVRAARCLLSSVTRVLLLADIVVVKQLLLAKDKVTLCKGYGTFIIFLNKNNGIALILFYVGSFSTLFLYNEVLTSSIVRVSRLYKIFCCYFLKGTDKFRRTVKKQSYLTSGVGCDERLSQTILQLWSWSVQVALRCEWASYFTSASVIYCITFMIASWWY